MQPKRILFVAAALGLTVAANAVAPFATARFEKRIEGTDKATPIASARLDDNVCIVIRDVSTPDGDHILKIVIYDGGGREVHQSIRTITATDGKWGLTLCTGFNQHRDMPGTWWYVVELDDEPLVSKELVVEPPQAASRG
jgi:hypothetical protein